MSNRVAVTKPVRLLSVNGPAVTVIEGNAIPGSTNGDAAIRCAYLTNGAWLIGFTLTNGATLTSGDYTMERCGGGAWCASPGAVLSNCVIVGNSAYSYGGGVYSGSLFNCSVLLNSATEGAGGAACNMSDCTITQNRASWSAGGVRTGNLTNCTIAFNYATSYAGGASVSAIVGSTLMGNCASYGGGSASGWLLHCTIISNSVSGEGGGTHYGSLGDCLLIGNSAGDGGGSYSGTISNCTYIGNSATNQGGGIFNGNLINCTFSENKALYGGGMNSSLANNCTVTGNSASTGGGTYSGTLNNCIIYFNYAQVSPNYYNGTLNYCCALPLPIAGEGNVATDPLFAGAPHLSSASPCRGAGKTSYLKGLDIDGEPWTNPPSIGCDEFYTGVATGALSLVVQAAYTNVATGFAVDLAASIRGYASGSFWDFGDGTSSTNEPNISRTWLTPGDYLVTAGVWNDSSPQPVTASILVHVVPQTVHYVDLTSASPTSPYTNWLTAAGNIQDAIDASTTPGALVLVNDGTYALGGRVVFGTLSNRVAITKPVIVQSVNGPGITTIQGYGIRGDAAVRCAFVTNRASLIGFTLANGATRNNGDINREQSGAGAWCASPGAVVANCLIVSNVAQYAGGVFGGTIKECTLGGNSGPMTGGGAYYATLTNCVLTGNSSSGGGGAGYSRLFNCTLVGNTSSGYGGGAMSCWLSDCLVSSNSAPGYGTGGGVYSGILSNCTLLGNTANNSGGGASAATLTQCSLLTNSASTGGGASGSKLYNCRLAGNSASSGGGLASGSAKNCTLVGNSATSDGGGSSGANLANSVLTGNWALQGGAASSGTLSNCTLTGNSASHGGGTYYANLDNCIVYYNHASMDPAGANYSGDTLTNCCTTPLPGNGAGNIAADPQLANFSHLSGGSPCRAAGKASFATGWDIDGEAWANPPAIGCDEFYPGSAVGNLSVDIQPNYTNVAVGFAVDFIGGIEGQPAASAWDFGDGTVVSNKPYVSHNWTSPGDRTVILRAYNQTFPSGIAAARVIHVVAQPVHYAAVTNKAPVAPFTSWITAATNIQDAVDAAEAGATVLVAGGTYNNGGRVVYGSMSNRLAVTKPVTVQSISGPTTTVIEGYQVPTTTNGDNAIRCVYLGTGARLSGFTLRKGATRSSGDLEQEGSGGGVWTGLDGVVTNCVITGNVADDFGGGAYYGIFHNCIFAANQSSTGGGAFGSTLINCLLTNNVAAAYGGGIYGGTLANCTVISNSAYQGGGASQSILNNCIVYYNRASTGSNYSSVFVNYCCTAPLPSTASGQGNFTNAPLFTSPVGGNLHLQSTSPCINSGLNTLAPATKDLDGNSRILGGTVDVGAYEYTTPLSVISYAWLRQYNLSQNGSADYADPDGDGMSNWQEWIANTNPTNSTSALKLLRPTNSAAGLILSWTSVADRTYQLDRATNGSSPWAFSPYQSNLAGRDGVTIYTDTNSLLSPKAYYRIRAFR